MTSIAREPCEFRDTTIYDRICSVFLITFSFLTAIFGSIYVLAPSLVLMLVNHRLWRNIIDRTLGFWLVVPAALIEFLFGTRIRVTGSRIDGTKPALIIMNHRTCLDWLFFWNALLRIDPYLLASLKISLKNVLKRIPGLGWAMECNVFLFLKRSFDKDEMHINSVIDYYANSGFNYQLLLFPEGTDKCPRATERSRIYAEKKNLVHYNHVLHPRTAGFISILKLMKQGGYISDVYDVTVAYADCIVQSEASFLLHGACPRSVHFDITKYDIESLPDSDEKLTEWLKKLWVLKDAKLSRFYSEECVSKRNFITGDDATLFELSDRTRILMVCATVFWTIVLGLWIHNFFTHSYTSLLAVFAVLVFYGAEAVYGGVEFAFLRFLKNKKQ